MAGTPLVAGRIRRPTRVCYQCCDGRFCCYSQGMLRPCQSWLPLLCLGASLTSAGCIDTDAAVFVEASISEPATTVTSNSLGTYVGGSCQVSFHLGPRASGPSEVSLRTFTLMSADQTSEVAPSLKVTTAPDFPVTVDVDSDVGVGVSYAEQDNPQPAAALDQLCNGAGIVIVGTFDDSLRGGSITAVSAPYSAAGCP